MQPALLHNVQQDVKPFLKAWLFAYLTTTSPRLLGLVLKWRKGGQRLSRNDFERVKTVLRFGFRLHSFPMVCALMAGSIHFLRRTRMGNAKGSWSNFSAGFIAAWAGMKLLHASRVPGKTMELTLFTAGRAIDVLLRDVVSQRFSVPLDTAVFALSAWSVMFSWLYHPDRLERSYRLWITKLASMDERLIVALRLIWQGRLEYGALLNSDILEDYACGIGMPISAGNFSQTIPIPCRLVHNNTTGNCETYALWRWQQGFVNAMKMYLPLSVFAKLHDGFNARSAKGVVLEASRSSGFIATFIACVWYSVCLTRSRIGPKLGLSPIFLDTWAPMVGCIFCGWTVVIEKPARRMELALFLSPRGLSMLVPLDSQKYHNKYEKFVFALSVGIIMSGLTRAKVRGVFGRMMGRIMQ